MGDRLKIDRRLRSSRVSLISGRRGRPLPTILLKKLGSTICGHKFLSFCHTSAFDRQTEGRLFHDY